MKALLDTDVDKELLPLVEELKNLRKRGKILVAVLYGSYAEGMPHKRSDIDLAVFINAKDQKDEIETIDEILTSVERGVSILRLDDADESPFIIQHALKGIHLVDPDGEALYQVSHRVLHESEGIRYRRERNNPSIS